MLSHRGDGWKRVVAVFQPNRYNRMAVMWPTGSRKMIVNVAEDMGRDWRQLAAAIDELPPFHVVVIPRGKNGGPLIVTSAPRL